MASRDSTKAGLIGAACLALASVGCAQLRLPAIDPSGRRLFLPRPFTTTLATHPRWVGDGLQTGRFPFARPRSAFPTPPNPPPCDPEVTDPASAPAPGATDTAPAPLTPSVPRVVDLGPCTDPQIQPLRLALPPDTTVASVNLYPRRVMAPVGGEVFLIGGLCDEGYYRVHEPVDWVLSQNSVGNFVDPGTQTSGGIGHGLLLGHLCKEPLPELLSNRYALAITSRRAQVLTRGTAEPSDDLFVLQGQTWISVTSPAEGTSYVTLVAPELDDWQRRHATAMIHWIDAQWSLPAPVIAVSDQPATLTTTLLRLTTSTPISGWIVRYEVADGAPAVFGAEGASVKEGVTDATGRASVAIRPAGPSTNTTRIRIQIIRPSQRADEPDRLVVGEGETSVTWGATQLTVDLTGPDQVQQGTSTTYQIEVVNNGNLPATDVTAQYLIPLGVEYVSAEPAGKLQGSRVDWTMAQLGPGERRTFQVDVRAIQPGVVRHCARVMSQGSEVEDCLTATVTGQLLDVSMSGPEQAEVGQMVQYRIVVTNLTEQTLADVLLVDEFDAGFQHEEGSSPIEWAIGSLAPRESRRVQLLFTVQGTGRICHTLQATATGSIPATARACLDATEARRPALSVRKTGPSSIKVGEEADFYILLENTGDVPLTGLEVVDQYDAELQLLTASPQPDTLDRNRAVWTIPQISAGQRVTLQVRVRALFERSNVCSQATVRTAEGLEQSDGVCLPIVAAAAVQPSPAPGAPAERAEPDGVPAPPEGRLVVNVQDGGERFRVGDMVEYLIVIHNDRDAPDSDVRVTLRLPRQVTLKDYRAAEPAAQHSADWRVLVMTPIRTLRAGERVEFEVFADVIEPGLMTFRAEATSLLSPQPVVAEEPALAERQ